MSKRAAMCVYVTTIKVLPATLKVDSMFSQGAREQWRPRQRMRQAPTWRLPSRAKIRLVVLNTLIHDHDHRGGQRSWL